MSDADLFRLYTPEVLALAAAIPHLGRLPASDGAARLRAPLCGSTLAVEVGITDGRVGAFAQEVQACALGQASAAIFGARALGMDRAAIARLRAQVARMLAGGPPPDPPFDAYALLAPARDYPSRHASILLTIDATLAAIDAAR